MYMEIPYMFHLHAPAHAVAMNFFAFVSVLTEPKQALLFTPLAALDSAHGFS